MNLTLTLCALATVLTASVPGDDAPPGPSGLKSPSPHHLIVGGGLGASEVLTGLNTTYLGESTVVGYELSVGYLYQELGRHLGFGAEVSAFGGVWPPDLGGSLFAEVYGVLTYLPSQRWSPYTQLGLGLGLNAASYSQSNCPGFGPCSNISYTQVAHAAGVECEIQAGIELSTLGGQRFRFGLEALLPFYDDSLGNYPLGVLAVFRAALPVG